MMGPFGSCWVRNVGLWTVVASLFAVLAVVGMQDASGKDPVRMSDRQPAELPPEILVAMTSAYEARGVSFAVSEDPMRLEVAMHILAGKMSDYDWEKGFWPYFDHLQTVFYKTPEEAYWLVKVLQANEALACADALLEAAN